MEDIVKYLGPDKSTIYRWKRIEKERGFDPVVSSHIPVQYLIDAPRSRRPTLLTELVRMAIKQTITKNLTTR
jgi:hypothetical protein